MTTSDLQMLMAQFEHYSGAIDDDAGPKTWAGVAEIESLHRAKYPSRSDRWTNSRRLVGAAQVLLAVAGYEPGPVDGYAGHNTGEALTSWRNERAGISSKVDWTAIGDATQHPAQQRFPRQADMHKVYGVAGGPDCTAGKVELPVPMIIAWNPVKKINRFSCHKLLAVPLTGIFRDAFAHYGEADFELLGLNVFGGCFNHRNKRGGRTLSTHAYGAAVDLNPTQNRLRWGRDRAQFAKPEYTAFWQIVMAHGATPAGYAWGKDWMHFQFARL